MCENLDGSDLYLMMMVTVLVRFMLDMLVVLGRARAADDPARARAGTRHRSAQALTAAACNNKH